MNEESIVSNSRHLVLVHTWELVNAEGRRLRPTRENKRSIHIKGNIVHHPRYNDDALVITPVVVDRRGGTFSVQGEDHLYTLGGVFRGYANEFPDPYGDLILLIPDSSL